MTVTTDDPIPDTPGVRTALTLAHSDAEAERHEGIAWLLTHPEASEPIVADEVRSGRTTNPELALRLLATMGRQESVGAMEAALGRGHEAESFYAAHALAAHPGPEALRVLRRALRHPSAVVRAAAAAALRPAERGR